MDFSHSPRCQDLIVRVRAFIKDRIAPVEADLMPEILAGNSGSDWTQWQVDPRIETLKQEAKDQGLRNLFLPDEERGAGLSTLEYAPLAEEMGRSHLAPQVFNCNAPDTGNMEVLVRYANEAQKEQWLKPLLAGEIRSAFAMTEPDVASSDATNIQCRIERDGGDYVINGRKWWTSGIGSPHCRILILMGKTDPNAETYRQQSMILVPIDTPGVKVERMLDVMGFDDAPHGHGEVTFTDVRVPAENMLLGEGRGFEIAQGRLGPGRIHHCMRIIGVAERALAMMCQRVTERVTWGKALADRDVTQERIAESRIEIDMCRLLVLKAAWMMDTVGNKAARQEIAMIKVAAPNMALRVIDRAMQAFGGAGMCQDTPLAYNFARMRALKFADGPDEVHRRQIARMELKRRTGWRSSD